MDKKITEQKILRKSSVTYFDFRNNIHSFGTNKDARTGPNYFLADQLSLFQSRSQIIRTSGFFLSKNVDILATLIGPLKSQSHVLNELHSAEALQFYMPWVIESYLVTIFNALSVIRYIQALQLFTRKKILMDNKTRL